MINLTLHEIEVLLQLLEQTPVTGRQSIKFVLSLIDKLETEQGVLAEVFTSIGNGNGA